MDIGIGSLGAQHAQIASSEGRANKLVDEMSRSTPEEAAKKMEALFATILVKELRRAMPEGGFFGDGPGADTYNGWFDEHLGAELANSGSLDLAGMVKTALEAKAQSALSEDGKPEEPKPMVIRGLHEKAVD